MKLLSIGTKIRGRCPSCEGKGTIIEIRGRDPLNRHMKSIPEWRKSVYPQYKCQMLDGSETGYIYYTWIEEDI